MAVVASFFIALLSGLGVGGGGLLVVFLNLFTDLSQLVVQGINLLFFLFSSGSAVLVHISRRQIFVFAVFIMALCGIVGAVGGMLLASFVGERLLRKIFGGMLVVSGMLALQKKKREKALRK